MEKVIRDGKVAVLYSPGYGAGWYTWNNDNYKQLIFQPTLVKMVEEGKQEEITEELCQNLLGLSDGDYVCDLGVSDLEIKWVKEGTPFYICENDGHEYIITVDDCLVA